MARKSSGRSSGKSQTTTISRGRRSGRRATALQVQRSINQDYLQLFRDYERLALKLWRKPAVRYIASGALVAALIPMAMRVFRRYPEIDSFIRENLDNVEEKLEHVGERISEKISELRGESDEFAESRH